MAGEQEGDTRLDERRQQRHQEDSLPKGQVKRLLVGGRCAGRTGSSTWVRRRDACSGPMERRKARWSVRRTRSTTPGLGNRPIPSDRRGLRFGEPGKSRTMPFASSLQERWSR